MWIEASERYSWEEGGRYTPDVGSVPVLEPTLPVERNGESHPHIIHRMTPVSMPSTSRECSDRVAIYGGADLGRFHIWTGLLHKDRHLSTDNRDLPTISWPEQHILPVHSPQI